MNRTGALDGIRVLEVGEGVTAAWAAKLLGDLGAEVIKVEPPGGDPTRHLGPFPPDAEGNPNLSGLFVGMNTNKSSTVLDLHTPHGQIELAELVAHADIVVHNLSVSHASAVGLGGADLLARHPALVVCAITPFGHTGPHAGWRGEEINVVHGGGWGMLIPGDGQDPDAPPLTVPDNAAQCQAAMVAAMAALASFDKRSRTGIGEFIDMSVMAHVSAALETAFIAWSYRREIATRTGGRILTPWRIFPCSDGLIFLATIEQDQWLRLVDMMGNPEWAKGELFDNVAARAQNQDVLNIYIQEWTAQHTVDWLFHEGQRRRICFAPVFEMADLAAQEHLISRGFFRTLDQPSGDGDPRPVKHLGPAFVASPPSWSLRTPAPVFDPNSSASFQPRTGTHPAAETPQTGPTVTGPTVTGQPATRPLTGIRVVDFSWVWAGPFATLHLSHLGADVIKVESSQRPGLGRRLPVSPPEIEPTLNTCAYFNQWDQGKRSVELDLSSESGRQQVLDLIASADIVIDNYATGVMDRLGLSDTQLRSVNSSLIIASITGFGHTGPLAGYMGYGPTTAPLSGLAAMTGHVDGPPVEAGISFGDPAAGVSAAFAIVAAIIDRRRHGHGTRIDVSLWEATAVNAVEGWMTWALRGEQRRPMGNRHMRHAPHGCFPCAGDDQWISLACTSDEQWDAMSAEIDQALCADPRFRSQAGRKHHEDELVTHISAWTRGQDPWPLAQLLQTLGIAAYPSLKTPEVATNPQHIARGFFEHLDHPEVGIRTHTGVPWRMHNSDNGVVSRAPLLGEHTAEILGESAPG